MGPTIAGSNGWFSKVLASGKLTVPPKYKDILPVLRHGLSHGNIWTDKKHEDIDNIFIANYPSNSNKQIQVLLVRPCTLRCLAASFIDWYRKISESDDAKNMLASDAMLSSQN